MSHPKRLATLVGGGPAPGINSVIGAATIRGLLEGVDVLGVRDDFEDAHELAKYAATCGKSLQDFRAEFEGLIATEPPPLELRGVRDA